MKFIDWLESGDGNQQANYFAIGLFIIWLCAILALLHFLGFWGFLAAGFGSGTLLILSAYASYRHAMREDEE